MELQAQLEKPKEAIDGVVSKIRNFYHFHQQKEGPLSDLHKLNFGTIATGFMQAKQPLVEQWLLF